MLVRGLLWHRVRLKLGMRLFSTPTICLKSVQRMDQWITKKCMIWRIGCRRRCQWNFGTWRGWGFWYIWFKCRTLKWSRPLCTIFRLQTRTRGFMGPSRAFNGHKLNLEDIRYQMSWWSSMIGRRGDFFRILHKIWKRWSRNWKRCT